MPGFERCLHSLACGLLLHFESPGLCVQAHVASPLALLPPSPKDACDHIRPTQTLRGNPPICTPFTESHLRRRLPDKVTRTDSGDCNVDTCGGHYSASHRYEGRRNYGEEGRFEGGGQWRREKWGWRGTLSRSFPAWASVSHPVKRGECRMDSWAVRVLQHCTAQVLGPAATIAHVLSLRLCRTTSCLSGSSPRDPTFLLPTGRAPPPCNLPPPPAPRLGLMHCSLSLRIACWLLSLLVPRPARPVTSNHSNTKHFPRSMSAAQWPCLDLERQHLAMNSDLQGGGV